MDIIIDKNEDYNIKDICKTIETNSKSNIKTNIKLINFNYIETEEFIDDLIEELIWYMSLSDIEELVEIENNNDALIRRIYEFYSNSRQFIK